MSEKFEAVDLDRLVAAEVTIQSGAPAGRQAQAAEVAERIRLLAATDPRLAAEMVEELVAALDRATGGAFADQLTGVARSAAGLEGEERDEEVAAAGPEAPRGTGVPFGGGYGEPPVTVSDLEAAARESAARQSAAGEPAAGEPAASD